LTKTARLAGIGFPLPSTWYVATTLLPYSETSRLVPLGKTGDPGGT
jgi:hypothetical protein